MKKLTNEELTHHHIIVSNREEEKKENVEIRNVPSSSAIVFCVMWRTKNGKNIFFQTSIKMKEKRAKFSNNNFKNTYTHTHTHRQTIWMI